MSALAFVPAAAAQTVDPPCPAGTPAPKFTVDGKATGPVYTTQALTVRVKSPGDPGAFAESFVVTGVRLLAEPEGGDVVNAMADSPSTLAASAVMRSDRGPNGDPCTVAGSASFEVKAATTPVVSKLRRPRPLPADPPLLRDTDFSFTVKPGPTGDRNPLTVEARAVLRAKLPGKGVKAKTKTVGLREQDIVEDGGRFPGRTPFGVDVKVLQSGRTIARLRVAGECRPFGQFSKCRYKKLTTKLG